MGKKSRYCFRTIWYDYISDVDWLHLGVKQTFLSLLVAPFLVFN